MKSKRPFVKEQTAYFKRMQSSVCEADSRVSLRRKDWKPLETPHPELQPSGLIHIYLDIGRYSEQREQLSLALADMKISRLLKKNSLVKFILKDKQHQKLNNTF